MRSPSISKKPFRIAFIGWGAIARRVADLLADRHGDALSIEAVCLRADDARPDGLGPDVPVIVDPSDLELLDLDLVVEAAGRGAVAEWGPAAMRAAEAFVVASTSALCDDALFDRLLDLAEEQGSQLLVPPGALAGVDAIAAASALPLKAVVHRIVKPPKAWKGTPAEEVLSLDTLTKAATFFEGTARDAAQSYPQNANVAVISALAGIGLDKTRVELVADPIATGNRHELTATGDFGTLTAVIENRPLASNPKSSEMAALSLVRLIENRALSLVR